MQRIRSLGTAGEENPVEVRLSAEITFPQGMPQSLRSEAEERVAMVLRREAQRISEIALVDAQDALAWPAEAERIRNAPKDRSHVIVSAGSREAVERGDMDLTDAVQVVRGEVEVGGRTLRERGRK